MKLKRNSNIIIAKNIMPKANTVFEPLDYQKWVDFVDSNSDIFIWKEDTAEGKQIFKDIDKVPENFKERVLSSLNKVICYSDYNEKRGTYNLYAGFNEKYNWITINIAQIPKSEDLEIFVKMAEHLDALLLVDGTKVINEETLKNLT
jgi:hypothetical protein